MNVPKDYDDDAHAQQYKNVSCTKTTKSTKNLASKKNTKQYCHTFKPNPINPVLKLSRAGECLEYLNSTFHEQKYLN